MSVLISLVIAIAVVTTTVLIFRWVDRRIVAPRLDELPTATERYYATDRPSDDTPIAPGEMCLDR